MTDTEIRRREAICKVAGVAEIDDVSDGFHTFRQLYYQRMMLFATIVRQNKDKAWKSLRHEDGELCFGGGWFIVGVDTPEGSYTYHYEDNYFSLFDCEELECSKHWDGHTEKDVTRLLSLPTMQPESTRTFVELVVKYPDPELCTYKEYKGKPYYSIKYIENGETYIGYGTYNPEVLSQYLKEYFLLSAQPETAKRIVGKSRDGMTLWYQCDTCNEPVDAQDNYCRGCGRRLIDG